MKKYLIGLAAILLITTAVYAAKSPFPPWLQQYINANYENGRNVKRVAKAVFDTANGATAGTAYNLGVSLPANALVTQAYMYFNTQFVDSGVGAISFECEDSQNLFAYADLTSYAAGSKLTMIPTGSAATMVAAIANGCNITANVRDVTPSAGKVTLFVEYVQY